MKKRNCKCGMLYSEGPLIATDWAYWDRSGDTPICPECQGIDVGAEMDRVALAQPTAKRPPMCEGCGIYRADPPSKLCPGCQAYRDHTR